MPIYAYRCETCGFQQDVLQKMSDPLLVTCPSCGQPTLKKQVTAAGFQLKGSGWYVTDFRNPAAKEATKKADGEAKGDAAGNGDAKPTSSDAPAAPAAAPQPATPDTKPAPAPAKAAPPPSGDG